MNHLLHSTDLFECYCWQKYTAVSNTDLYLSYLDLSYIFPGHNDSAEWGPTVPIQMRENMNEHWEWISTKCERPELLTFKTVFFITSYVNSYQSLSIIICATSDSTTKRHLSLSRYPSFETFLSLPTRYFCSFGTI